MSTTLWCPVCGDEFRAGIVRCGYCDAELVNERPETLGIRNPVENERPETLAIRNPVEYDLRSWSAEQCEGVEAWLRAELIPFEWTEPGVVAVPRSRTGDVEEITGYLAVSPEKAAADSDPQPYESSGWDVPIAGPGRRVVGFVLDWFVVATPAAVAALVGHRARADWSITLLVSAVYHVALIARFGRTAGCAAVGVRVVRFPGDLTPGWRRAFIRWAVCAGPALVSFLVPIVALVELPWLVVVYAGVFRRPWRRGLHDRASGVVVVATRGQPISAR